MTIADSRVDAVQLALAGAANAHKRLGRIQRELDEVRQALHEAADAMYNAILDDPEAQHDAD